LEQLFKLEKRRILYCDVINIEKFKDIKLQCKLRVKDLVLLYTYIHTHTHTLKTWKASNCILRDFSFSMFIINFKLSGFDIYRVITCNNFNMKINSDKLLSFANSFECNEKIVKISSCQKMLSIFYYCMLLICIIFLVIDKLTLYLS